MGTNEEDANEFVKEAMISPSRESKKPDISKLPDAVDKDGKLVVEVGDKIVIESYIDLGKKKKYLHTRIYLIKKIDEETGDVQLYDESYKQSAQTNVYRAVAKGDIIKMHTQAVKIEEPEE